MARNDKRHRSSEPAVVTRLPSDAATHVAAPSMNKCSRASVDACAVCWLLVRSSYDVTKIIGRSFNSFVTQLLNITETSPSTSSSAEYQAIIVPPLWCNACDKQVLLLTNNE